MMQNDRMSEQLPFGSRGGTAIPYFPVDGEYVIKVTLHRTGNDHIIGLGAPHELDVRLDGSLIKRFTVGGDQWVKMAPPENYSSNLKADDVWEDYPITWIANSKCASRQGRASVHRHLVRR